VRATSALLLGAVLGVALLWLARRRR